MLPGSVPTGIVHSPLPPDGDGIDPELDDSGDAGDPDGSDGQRSEAAALRRELRRREREHREVVRRYERLLSAKNERIDELSDELGGDERGGACGEGRGGAARVSHRLASLLDRRR